MSRLANWQIEKTGARTYRTLAERELDVVRSQNLHLLAEAEERHASLWADRFPALGIPEPTYHGKSTGEADSLKTGWADPNLPLGVWRSTKVAILQDMESSSKSLTTRPALLFFSRFSTTNGSIIES